MCHRGNQKENETIEIQEQQENKVNERKGEENTHYNNEGIYDMRKRNPVAAEHQQMLRMMITQMDEDEMPTQLKPINE